METQYDRLVSDPFSLLADVKTVILLIMPYRPSSESKTREAIISAYYPVSHAAYQAAKELVKHLEKEGFKAVSNVQLPLKRLMLTFGIGSMGRNSLVVIDGLGSAFHVQALLTDASFQYSYYKEVQPVLGKRCGNCLSCVMACPTGAISADGHVEAAKCLRAVSEMDIIPQEYEPLLKNRLLGCDVCQNVCPANARLCTAEPVEVTLKSLLDGNIDGLKRLIGSNYARVNKLKKKAAVIAANNRRYDLIDELENMRLSADSSVAYAAERAIKRMEEEV